VDFDPSVISYAHLVDLVLTSHDPRWKARKAQYASIVLAHDEQQLAVAQERTAHFSAALGAPLATRVEPLEHFWLAEDYHQKYYLRNDRLLSADFRAMFDGDESAFRESTSAARVNGYVAGHGDRVQLASEIAFLGLSDNSRALLISHTGSGVAAGGCTL
jgi:peptide-methionine (S)-S-oxide reductase